jgi:hypothetical protein
MNRIGYWQHHMLQRMFKSKQGAFYSLMGLRGNAKKYEPVYQRHLLKAIELHNAGVISGKNRKRCSPIPVGYKIDIGKYGPKGGRGYLLVKA